MRLTAKNYREQLYRLRSHPRSDEFSFHDQRDSFAMVYLSVIPFGILEYLVEASDALPGGLIFPVGFLLFWAFYYTYYKPGFLENRLTSPTHWDLTAVPVLLVGVLIWFVKVTLVELSHLVLLQWWAGEKPRPAARPKATAHAGAQAKPGPARPGSNAPPQLLPADAIDALLVLGLKPGCTWRDIHRQYRALAKQFHPDLNPEITDFGRRFMKVDTAYHRLEKLRSKHFPN